jgi:hypothetical protein
MKHVKELLKNPFWLNFRIGNQLNIKLLTRVLSKLEIRYVTVIERKPYDTCNLRNASLPA